MVGDGIVTHITVAQPPLDLFEQGSWAAQFNADAVAQTVTTTWQLSGCRELDDPRHRYLDGQPVPEGGFTPNPTPDDESPVGFAVRRLGEMRLSWVVAYLHIHIGTQQSTSGGYSLSVTAYFQEVDGPSPVGVRRRRSPAVTDEFYSSTIGVDGGNALRFLCGFISAPG